MRTRTALIFIALLTGCTGGETATSEPAKTAEAAAAPKAAAQTAAVDPCAILNETLLRSHFGEVTATFKPGRPTAPHPLCTASWPKPDAAKLEEERATQMSAYVAAKVRGEDVKMPSFATDNEVSLTLRKKSFKDQETAESAFDSAMRVLEHGIPATKDRPAITRFTTPVEPAAGVGRKAAWAPRMNQLSVLSGTQIFHVAVKVGDKEENLAKARAIALEIAAQIQ